MHKVSFTTEVEYVELSKINFTKISKPSSFSYFIKILIRYILYMQS